MFQGRKQVKKVESTSLQVVGKPAQLVNPHQRQIAEKEFEAQRELKGLIRLRSVFPQRGTSIITYRWYASNGVPLTLVKTCNPHGTSLVLSPYQ